MAKDRLGYTINVGDKVLVHQDDQTRSAIVIGIFEDSPTVNQIGCWIDVDCGDGVQGMPSYILEIMAL